MRYVDESHTARGGADESGWGEVLSAARSLRQGKQCELVSYSCLRGLKDCYMKASGWHIAVREDWGFKRLCCAMADGCQTDKIPPRTRRDY